MCMAPAVATKEKSAEAERPAKYNSAIRTAADVRLSQERVSVLGCRISQ